MANPADPPKEGAAVKDWMAWCAAQLEHYEREAERARPRRVVAAVVEIVRLRRESLRLCALSHRSEPR